MTAQPLLVPLHRYMIGVIPAATSPVVILGDGTLQQQSMVGARGDAIALLLQRYGERGTLHVIVQDAPWPRTDAPATSAEVAKARSIAETAIRWAALCEEHGVRIALVRRATWIVGLRKAGLSQDDTDDRIDSLRTATLLAHAPVLPTHADAVCLAYWGETSLLPTE